MNKKPYFLDTETHLFGQGEMAPKLVCCSYRHGKKTGLMDHDKNRAWLKGLLEMTVEGHYVLVAHNAAYDFAVLAANYPELRPLIFAAYQADGIVCTMIREKLLDIADARFRGYRDQNNQWVDKNYHLSDLAKWYLNREMDKGDDGWRLRYKELDGIPIEEWPERARHYAMTDAEILQPIYDNQEKRAAHIGYKMPTQFDDSRASFALHLTSCWGLRTDEKQLTEIDEKITKRMASLRKILHKHGLMRTKRKMDEKRLMRLGNDGYTDSRIQFSKNLVEIRRLVEHCLKDKTPKTDKGHISTAAETLEMCEQPALEALAEFVGLEKTQGTYLRRMYDGIDYPIHPRFNAIGAASDRTSSYNPNLQNQPRLPGVRECYIPRKGHDFVACDFDSQEMRTLAQTLVDLASVSTSELAKRYQENPDFDPHLEFAARRLGRTVETAKKLKEAGSREVKEARQHAKIANFGLPGGMGIRGLIKYAKGYGVTMNEEEAQGLRKAWLRQWSEMGDYFSHVSKACAVTDECTVTIPQSGFRRAACSYTEACNTYFQSLAAHASKAALWEVTRRCFVDRDSMLYGSRPVIFVHDEIIIEVEREWAHLAAKELEVVMVEQMKKFTPDIPPAASAAIMHRWSKDAEPVYENGRLVTWVATA